LKEVMKIMVDTVKLLIPISDPMILSRGAFSPLTIEQLVNTKGTARTYLNPSPTYAKMGKYMPRLTLHRRPAKTFGIAYQLVVEFSAPKMLFKQNFDELVETDFERVLSALQEALLELTGHRFFKSQLAEADIASWHPSKNIVFLDYTSCQTILNTIGKLDISRIYDFQRTNFRDGHVVHIHCNSLDIAFYDKLADLRKSKLSDKRAVEKNGLIQLNLLEPLQETVPIEVFRYEVRIVGRASIKRAFPQLEKWTFEALFKKQLNKDILLQHWHKLTSAIDMLSLDVHKPYELLQNYLIDNPDATPQAAMAAVTGLLINGQEGVINLRNLLEAHYGKQAWYRLKPLLKSPQAHRFTHFQHIDEALERFTPTRMSEYIKLIENNSK